MKVVEKMKIVKGKELWIEVDVAPLIRLWMVEYFKGLDKTKCLSLLLCFVLFDRNTSHGGSEES